MKFKIESQKLNAMLATVGIAAAGRIALPVLCTVLIEAGKDAVSLRCFNLETEVKVSETTDVEDAGALCVNFATLKAFVADCDGEVKFEKDKKLSVQCGQSRVNIPFLESSEFPASPEIQNPRSLNISGAAFKKAIEATIGAASIDTGRRALMSVCWRGANMIASNGSSLHAATVEKIDGDDVLMTRATAAGLLKMLPDEEITLSVGINRISIRTGLIYASFSLLEMLFPNVSAFLGEQPKCKATFNLRELLGAIKSLAALSDDSFPKIKFEIKKTSAVLKCGNDGPDSIAATREVACTAKEPSTFSAKPSYLIAALEHQKGDDISIWLDDPKMVGRISIKEPTFQAVIMPIRTE